MTAKTTRTKASKDAISKAIEAAQSCGLSVDSLLIDGGKVELKLAAVDGVKKIHNVESPLEWD